MAKGTTRRKTTSKKATPTGAGSGEQAEMPTRQPDTANEPPSASATAAPGAEAPQDQDSSPTDEEIAARAYERYQARGGSGGQDIDDWLEAERELRKRRRR
jgi:hypothetical protein